MRSMDSMLLTKNKYFIVGVIAGVVLSLILMPFLEECQHSTQSNNNWYSLIVNNDYNPVIRLNHKMRNQTIIDEKKGVNRAVLRPRFHTTELKIKDNLLICILLSQNNYNYFSFNNYLFNQTIRQFSDKVLIFYENFVTTEVNEDLRKVFNNENDYILLSDELIDHPIQVPFSKSTPKYLKILNYLFKTKVIENFNFIFIISDKTYVNQNNLCNFLNNFTVSQYIFASPIIASDDNYLDINSKSNQNHILESGVIFSSSLLLKCNSDIICLNKYKNNYPNPTQPTFMSYHLKLNNLNQHFILNNQLFSKSLTTYPINSFDTHYRLHLIWSQNAIIDSINSIKLIESQISETSEKGMIGWPLGVESSQKPSNRFEVIRWTYFNESHYLMPNDFDVSLQLNKYELSEFNQIRSESIKWIKNRYKNHIFDDKIQIINFYRKFDAIRGLEYLIDFRHKAFPDIKRLQLIKPLNRVELLPGVPYVTENTRIVMVLPIRSHEEIESALIFLTQYTNVCLKKPNHQTILILILINQLNDDSDEYLTIREHAAQLQTKYKNSGAKLASIPIISAKDRKVPSEIAYLDILSKKLSFSFSDALILNCRTNMIISSDFLNRVRLNTIQSNQIFFPIPFVEYRLRSQVKPLKNFDVRKDNGYFDSTDFTHVSFYLSDYLKIRKLSENLIPIAKNEQYLKRSIYYNSDTDLFHLFVYYNSVLENTSKPNKLFLMRAIEPELKLRHESFSYDCLSYESNTYAVENCLKRNLIGLGSRRQLSALIIDDNRKDGQEMIDEENPNVF